MPNQLTAAGLETKTRAELLAEKTADLQAIYGADINLASDTPDGQKLNLELQSILDLIDLLVAVYNSMDPDKAIGVALDSRAALNGIQRQGGTFTITNVTIATDRALNLTGLDALDGNPEAVVYTVRDNAGNRFFLRTTTAIGAAGSNVLSFRAENPGAVLTIPNTITVAETVVLGVTSVNNPTTYTTLGEDAETDAEFRLRRQQSVAIASVGYNDGLRALLLNISGVTYAKIYENKGAATDSDGIPGHSIWVIVSGGTAAEIADAIYRKRNAGANMKGDETYTITQDDGSPFVVRWDEVAQEDLYIEFSAHSINEVDAINTDLIKAGLESLFAPDIAETVNITTLGTIVQEIDPNCVISAAGFSKLLAGPYTTTLAPTAKNNQFAVSAARISITVV